MFRSRGVVEPAIVELSVVQHSLLCEPILVHVDAPAFNVVLHEVEFRLLCSARGLRKPLFGPVGKASVFLFAYVLYIFHLCHFDHM